MYFYFYFCFLEREEDFNNIKNLNDTSAGGIFMLISLATKHLVYNIDLLMYL